MKYAQPHGKVQLTLENFPIFASKFVGGVNWFGLPVIPVENVFEVGNRENVLQSDSRRHDQGSFRSVRLDRFDSSKLAISPPKTLTFVIHGQTVGPLHSGGDKHLSLRSILACSFNFRISSPVGPVHKSATQNGTTFLSAICLFASLESRNKQWKIKIFKSGRTVPPKQSKQILMNKVCCHRAWSIRMKGIKGKGKVCVLVLKRRYPYPLHGSTTIARGFSTKSLITTLRLAPSRDDTSIRPLLESVQ